VFYFLNQRTEVAELTI